MGGGESGRRQMNLSESVSRARRVSSWQDYLLLFLLTTTYGIACGVMYTSGLLQSAWISEGTITANEAASINSVSFGMMLLPCPFIQALVHMFDMPSSLVFLISVPLFAGGILLSTTSTCYLQLLLGNAVVMGLANVFMSIGCWKSLFSIFTDDQIYLFNCVMSSGMGLGVVGICLLYINFEEGLGWRRVQQMQLTLTLFLLLDVLLMLPHVRRLIGLHTRAEKLKEKKPPQETAATAGRKLPGTENNSYQEPLVSERRPYEPGADEGEEEPTAEPQTLLNFHYSISLTTEMKTMELLASLLTNGKFLLILLSFTVADPVFNAIMVHQPSRMVHLGFSVKKGSQSLLYNGLVQLVLRMGVGFITSSNLVSPVRLSQFAKLTLAICTVLSNIFEGLSFQTFYMFYLGVAGGLINTTDFLLVKDTTTFGREMGIQLFMLTDGVASLLLIGGTGALLSQTRSYQEAFYSLAFLIFLSFLFSVVFECKTRVRTPKRQRYVEIE